MVGGKRQPALLVVLQAVARAFDLDHPVALFGREELDVIQPAVLQAQAEGMDVHGPFAPDTVFMRARTGEFDVVVAMYHDQGLIPVKYLGVEHGVNVTLGLPFVRTSPDHGTAFDLAGTGKADPSSLLAALSWAQNGLL